MVLYECDETISDYVSDELYGNLPPHGSCFDLSGGKDKEMKDSADIYEPIFDHCRRMIFADALGSDFVRQFD
jgi:hypothetical protein